MGFTDWIEDTYDDMTDIPLEVPLGPIIPFVNRTRKTDPMNLLGPMTPAVSGVINKVGGTSDVFDSAGNIIDDVTGVTAADAAERAAQKQTEYGLKALEQQQQQYDQTREDMSPWLEGGQEVFQRQLMPGVKRGRFDVGIDEFNPSDYRINPVDYDYNTIGGERFQSEPWSMENLANDPGYQFRLKQGMEAVKGSAAGAGNRFSGDTMKELMQFGQGLASQEASKAYGRYNQDRNFAYGAEQNYLDDMRGERAFDYGLTRDVRGDRERERGFEYGGEQDFMRNLANEKNARFNRLSAISGTGQTQGAQLGQLGQNYANTAGNTMMGIGNSQAAGMIGGANARQQGTQNLLNLGLTGASILFSDERLKTDIEYLGKWKKYKAYTYRYLWSPVKYIGVMAQDVLKVNPKAVFVSDSGYLAVNYGVL